MSLEQLVKSTQQLGGTGLVGTKTFSQQDYVATPKDNSINIQALSQIASWATNKYLNKPEEDKSKELFATLPIDKQREILNGGGDIKHTKTTVSNLKKMWGQLEANNYMTGLYQQAQDGKFNSPADLQKAYSDGLNKMMDTSAFKLGINKDDEDFIKGYSSSIHSGMMQAMAFVSNQHNEKQKATIEFMYTDQFNKLAVDNTQGLMNGSVANAVWDNFKEGVETLKIPTDKSAMTIMNNYVSSASNTLGGVKFLEDSRNVKLMVNGHVGTIESHIGKENYELLLAKAKQHQMEYTTSEGSKMAIELDKIRDPNMTQQERVAIIDKWKGWTNTWFPNEANNAYRQALTQATIGVNQFQRRQIEAMNQENAKNALKLEKSANYANNLNRRIAGEKGVPLTEDTLEGYTKDDILAGASYYIQGLKQLPPEEQPKAFAKALAADSVGGGIAAMLSEDFKKAQREFEGAIANGEIPESMPNFDWAYGIYKENPDLVAQHYPDMVGTFAKMNLMDKYGYKRENIITNEINNKKLKESGIDKQVDTDYKAAIESNEWSLNYPAQQMSLAQDIFKSTYAATGNPELAEKATNEFLESATWKPEEESKGIFGLFGGGSNDTYGRISRNILRLDDTPESYIQGAETMNYVIDKLKKSFSDEALTIRQLGDKIEIYTSNGSFNKIITNDELKQLAQLRQEELEHEAKLKRAEQFGNAKEELNKQAYISKVKKQAEELTEGIKFDTE